MLKIKVSIIIAPAGSKADKQANLPAKRGKNLHTCIVPVYYLP